jgi:acyl dehydratase
VGGALISTVLGTQLAGTGNDLPESDTCSFRRPVAIGDEVTVTVTATWPEDEEKKRVTFDCKCTNYDEKLVISRRSGGNGARPQSEAPPGQLAGGDGCTTLEHSTGG